LGRKLEIRRNNLDCDAILFDWDGTLVNSLNLKIGNAGVLFNDHFGYSVESIEKAYRIHSGVPRRALFDAILMDVGDRKLNDSEYDNLSNAFTELNLSNLSKDYLFSDTIETLDYLRGCGIKLFVSSSAIPEDVIASAAKLGISNKFVEVLGSIEGFEKGIDHVSYVCEKYKLNKRNIIMVGDDSADVFLAKSAEVYSIAKVGSLEKSELSELKPNRIIGSLSELSELINT
jgi:phosphoglycolate phosphatase-like HAD superfamily hydrolase